MMGNRSVFASHLIEMNDIGGPESPSKRRGQRRLPHTRTASDQDNALEHRSIVARGLDGLVTQIAGLVCSGVESPRRCRLVQIRHATLCDLDDVIAVREAALSRHALDVYSEREVDELVGELDETDLQRMISGGDSSSQSAAVRS